MPEERLDPLTPSHVTDHGFSSVRGAYRYACGVCGLAESAHAFSAETKLETPTTTGGTQSEPLSDADSGRIQEVLADRKVTVGHKDDDGKTQWSCVPWEAAEEMAQVMTFGARKYGAYNYREGMEYSRLFSALLRHTYAWQRGEDVDPESGKSHLSHAACCVLMLRDLEILERGNDDRWVG